MFSLMFWFVVICIILGEKASDFEELRKCKAEAEKNGKKIYQNGKGCWYCGYHKCIEMTKNGREVLVYVGDTSQVVHDFTLEKEMKEEIDKGNEFYNNMLRRKEAIANGKAYYKPFTYNFADQLTDLLRETETNRLYFMDKYPYPFDLFPVKKYVRKVQNLFNNNLINIVKEEECCTRKNYDVACEFIKKWGKIPCIGGPLTVYKYDRENVITHDPDERKCKTQKIR